MRLLLGIDSLTVGGAQRQMATLAIELARRGHEIRVVAYHDIDFFGPALRNAGIQTIVHAKKRQFEWRVVRTWAKEMAEGDYDAVLTFLTVPNIYGVIARRLVRRPPPLVVSHLASAVGSSFAWRDRLAARLYRFADRVVVNSHHMREYLCRRYRPIASRTLTIYNGIDLEKFALGPRPEPTNELRVLAIGNLAPGKNWICLARALARLREAHGLAARVTHIGRLDPLSPCEAANLQLIREYLFNASLSDQWEWLGEREDVTQLLHQHDALVHPSAQEGLPNAILEALACGCPVVAADALDHPRLIAFGENGFLFAPNDPQSLAGAMSAVNTLTAHERAKMGAVGRDFAERELSVALSAQRYETVIRDAIEARHQPPARPPSAAAR